MVQATTAPTSELGYQFSAPGYWSGATDWLEQTAELRWPNNIAIYDAMARQDAQVASMLRAVTMPVRRMRCRIEPRDARPEVAQMLAEDLGLPLTGKDAAPTAGRTRDRFSWGDHLQQALLCTRYGHAVFEQVYRIDPAGYARLRKLAYRPPQSIAGWDVALDGGLDGIRQYGATGRSMDTPIPVSRLVVYVLDREGGDWTGMSLLRPAYKNWLLKDRLLRTQAQTIERNGMGVPIYEGQQGATGDDLTKGQEIATNLRSGQNAGAATPYGAKLRLAGVEGTLPDAKPAIEYHDTQIARGMLAHFLTLGGMTGSWALGSTFADFFTMSLQALGDMVIDTVNQHVVEDWVDVNFGPDEPAPVVVGEEIGSRHDLTAQAIALLIQSGALQVDPAVREFVRDSFGLPMPTGDPIPTPTPIAPPADPGTETQNA
jgi:hypothetical protein